MKNVLLLFVLLPCLAFAQVDKKIIKQQAEQLAAAMISNDYQTIANFTHPKVVELLGGRDKMISIIKNGNIEMMKQGISFDKTIIGRPLDQVVKAGNEIHCLVPQTVFMKVPKGKMKQESHLLAISKDNGVHWYFIDTVKLTDENVKSVLPNFNSDLRIPAKKEAVFIKD